MESPCGHKEAQCIIGNFWNCSICNNTGGLSEQEDEWVTIWRRRSSYPPDKMVATRGSLYCRNESSFSPFEYKVKKEDIIKVEARKSDTYYVLKPGAKIARVESDWVTVWRSPGNLPNPSVFCISLPTRKIPGINTIPFRIPADIATDRFTDSLGVEYIEIPAKTKLIEREAPTK